MMNTSHENVQKIQDAYTLRCVPPALGDESMFMNTVKRYLQHTLFSVLVGTCGYVAARKAPEFSQKVTDYLHAPRISASVEKDKHALGIFVPHWKLKKIVQMLCVNDSTETVAAIKKYNRLKNITPGTQILIPFSLLKPELQTTQLTTFTLKNKGSRAQEIADRLKNTQYPPEIALLFSPVQPGRDRAYLDGLSSTIVLPTSLLK